MVTLCCLPITNFGDFAIDGFVGGTIYYYYDDAISSNTRNGLSIPGYYSLKASVDPIASSSSYKQKQVNSIYGKFSGFMEEHCVCGCNGT